MDSLLPFVLGFLGGVIAAVIFVVAYKIGRRTRPKAQAAPGAEAEAGALPVVDAPPNRDAVTPVLMRYLDAERDTWEGARRLVLSQCWWTRYLLPRVQHSRSTPA